MPKGKINLLDHVLITKKNLKIQDPGYPQHQMDGSTSRAKGRINLLDRLPIIKRDVKKQASDPVQSEASETNPKRKVNLLDKLPIIKRDVKKRAHERLLIDVNIAKKFDKEYFDGERRYGYGGYYYDGRWKPIAKKLIKHYNLTNESRILEIGCAKGFLLHEIQKLLPKCTVRGIDISEYARENAYGDMKDKIDIGSAHRLPYEDDQFDLVISINTLHNLPEKHCREAVCEIERVSRNGKFISVDAWKDDQEKQRILDWSLTSRTNMHEKDWEALLKEANYEGDYWFSVP